MPFRTLIAIFAMIFLAFNSCSRRGPVPFAIVIHGGAGTILREKMTSEMETAYKVKMEEAILAGYRILDSGGTAIEAVKTSIIILENSPLFNAGKGAVFNHEGKNELDAAIMDGSNRKAGAVAGVTVVKNPILAAYSVMTQTPHVLLSGKGADEFAKSIGLEIVDPSYFYTEARYKSLMEELSREAKKNSLDKNPNNSSGTVGAVALDRYGNIAAGTSTGGMNNKRYGRIGDTPVIGAGTYADNNTCAISATGHGEFFIRKVVAYDIAAKMKYLKISLQEAATQVIMDELPSFGGNGGVIGIDTQGNMIMEFNTAGMYRGYMKQGEHPRIFIFRD